MPATASSHRTRATAAIGTLTFLALFSAAALADDAYQSAPPAVQIVPTLGYRAFGGFEDATTGESRDLASAASLGVALDFRWDAGRFVQLWYSRQATDLRTDTGRLDVDVEYLHIGGTVDLESTNHWEPYFAAGIGGTKFSPGPSGLEDLTRFSGSLALGARWPLAKRVVLRTEMRGYMTLMDSDTFVFCGSSGGATCAVKVKGSSFLQAELSIGIAFGL
jgi:opacity protein-like surface antigen